MSRAGIATGVMGRAGVAAGLAAALVAGAGPAPAAAQPPTETIRGRVTWTREQSPVRIDGVHVLAGGSLTIEPGVEVVANPGGFLLLDGSLRAEGTEAQPVVFTSEGSWDGIAFSDGPRHWFDNALRHARIEHAAVGVWMGSGSFPVRDTTFTQNDVALRVDNPSRDVSFTDNRFYSNGTAFSARTRRLIAIHRSDFWDNEVSFFFEAQSPYSCASHNGIFDVHDNDILRGPDAPWFSYDVRRSEQSGETDMRVLASDNWWGSTDEFDIRGRMEREGSCCPGPHLTTVDWRDPASGPQTAPEPPGPVGNPPEGEDIHGDPDYIVDLRHPDWAECFPKGSIDRIEGHVHEVFGLPDEVPLTLVKGTTRCKSYDGTRFVAASCDEPVELVAPVTPRSHYGRFAFVLRRPLPPGRYTVRVGDFGPDVSKFRVRRG